jgi:hypothetical protein
MNGANAAAHRPWRQVDPGGLPGRFRPALLAALALLAYAGLLSAFQQVVSGAVQQGELRRVATLAHADAAWHCKVQSHRQQRDDCLAQLEASPLRLAALPMWERTQASRSAHDTVTQVGFNGSDGAEE